MMSLCDMIREARLSTPYEQREDFRRIMSKHFGLHVQIAKTANQRHPNLLRSYLEVPAYMLEALPILLEEWDEEKGMASTCWRKITLRLIRTYATENTTFASVRIPQYTKHKYKKESSDSTDAVNKINAHEYIKRSYKFNMD